MPVKTASEALLCELSDEDMTFATRRHVLEATFLLQNDFDLQHTSVI